MLRSAIPMEGNAVAMKSLKLSSLKVDGCLNLLAKDCDLASEVNGKMSPTLPSAPSTPTMAKQLKNWSAYLDFEIKLGIHERIVVLFERCLIPCAKYEVCCQNISEMVKTCQTLSKLVKTCQNMPKQSKTRKLSQNGVK